MRWPTYKNVIVLLISRFGYWTTISERLWLIIKPTRSSTSLIGVAFNNLNYSLLLFRVHAWCSLYQSNGLLNFGKLSHLNVPLFIDLCEINPSVIFKRLYAILALFDPISKIHDYLFNIFEWILEFLGRTWTTMATLLTFVPRLEIPWRFFLFVFSVWGLHRIFLAILLQLHAEMCCYWLIKVASHWCRFHIFRLLGHNYTWQFTITRPVWFQQLNIITSALSIDAFE